MNPCVGQVLWINFFCLPLGKVIPYSYENTRSYLGGYCRHWFGIRHECWCPDSGFGDYGRTSAGCLRFWRLRADKCGVSKRQPQVLTYIKVFHMRRLRWAICVGKRLSRLYLGWVFWRRISLARPRSNRIGIIAVIHPLRELIMSRSFIRRAIRCEARIVFT